MYKPLKDPVRITLAIIFILIGAGISIFSQSLLTPIFDLGRFITLFIPVILTALAFFFLGWQTIAGAKWVNIMEFLMMLIFHV